MAYTMCENSDKVQARAGLLQQFISAACCAASGPSISQVWNVEPETGVACTKPGAACTAATLLPPPRPVAIIGTVNSLATNSDAAERSTSLDGSVFAWCDAAIAPCTEPTADPTTAATAPEVAESHVKPLPQFRVPDGIDVNEEDDARSKQAVQAFARRMRAGVMLHIVIDGVDDLPVEASMDPELRAIELYFNGIKKLLPLDRVRSVLLDMTKVDTHAIADITASPNTHDQAPAASWQVRLELQDDTFCIFAFGAGEASLKNASFFGSCLLILSEAARFEAAKADLARACYEEVDDPESARCSAPIPVDALPPATTLRARRHDEGTRERRGCALDEEGAEELVAALLGVGTKSSDVGAGAANASAVDDEGHPPRATLRQQTGVQSASTADNKEGISGGAPTLPHSTFKFPPWATGLLRPPPPAGPAVPPSTRLESKMPPATSLVNAEKLPATRLANAQAPPATHSQGCY